MKLYDEENLCWADIAFWVLVAACIFIGGYGAVYWVWHNWILN